MKETNKQFCSLDTSGLFRYALEKNTLEVNNSHIHDILFVIAVSSTCQALLLQGIMCN